ncbi:MAG: hypothetical protein PHF46_03570 [Candidatus Gracilibacteria bacterium]|nr:hypothetical protein [Candidatus Gracilibacteria bacterium]MDD4530792.1 hypothetical protein [Candidatus Gracilibacteria bacterium]
MTNIEIGPFLKSENKTILELSDVVNKLDKFILYIRNIIMFRIEKDTQNEELTIKVNGNFIPGHILLYLSYFITKVNSITKITINCTPTVTEHLKNSGFLDFVNKNNITTKLDSVILPFNRFKNEDISSFGTLMIHNQNKFPNIFFDYPFELFANSQEHSNASYVYTFSQKYPKIGEMDFTIFDDGIGIVENSLKNGMNCEIIRQSKFLKNPDDFINIYGLNTIIIILCCVTKYSTRLSGGGEGLFRLSKLLNEHKGILNIYSGKEFLSIAFNQICNEGSLLDINDIVIKKHSTDSNIHGTYINFRFNV